jgi:hypothetical protein
MDADRNLLFGMLALQADLIPLDLTAFLPPFRVYP